MSKTIDQKVVEMRFDNAQFEKNVSTSMSTLDKLKRSLKLDDAAKGLESVNTAAKNFDVSNISNGVETVKAKFSALQVVAATALGNITNSAVNAGKRIVSALTIEPVKAGFEEYETQMNAVQTILANTQKEGTNVKVVNKALDELNTYADKTIYNFTEMTRNIGTFTAAGVKLDTSVSSIKGIANLAAVSGSTSLQASTAMYQLSQAIAAGKVQLMDWNSVVNAGMGGQVFQDALIRTSEHLKTGAKSAIKANGSFRESLQTGWLTTEVLTQTLDQFSTAADTQEEYEAAVKKFIDQGYTKEQAKQMADMARTAGEAATKVKTFTQLIDTLKEALGSGWTTTWRLIIGDFEEAKGLWTSVSDTLSEMINKSAEARNKVIEDWAKGGGRTMLIESLKNAFEGLMSIIKPIKEAFREIFPPITAQQLIKITERIRDLTAKFKLNDKQSAKLKSTFKGLFSIIKIGVSVVTKIVSAVATLVGKLFGFSGSVLDITGTLGDFVSGLATSISKSNLFGKTIDKITGFLGKAIDKTKEFVGAITEKIQLPSFDKVLNVIKKIGDVLGKITKKISSVASGIGSAISEAFKNGDFNTLVGLVNGGIITSILLSLKKFVKGFKDFKKEAEDSGGIKDRIVDVLNGAKDCLEEWQKSIKAGTILKIAVAIAILAVALLTISKVPVEKLGTSLGAITVLFGEMLGALALFNKINGEYNGAFKAVAIMIAMSVSLLILASAVKKLSDLGWEGLAKGLIGVSALMYALVGAAKLMSKGGKDISKGAIQLVIMAVALKIMASVCKDLSALSWEDLAKGVSGIGVILLEFAGFAALIDRIKPEKMMRSAFSLILIGAAMEIFANVCAKFGKMEWGDLGKAGAAIAGILLIAAGFGKLSGYTSKMTKSAVALILIGEAMKIFADICAKFGQMEWEELGKAGAAISGILLLAVGFTLLSGLADKMLRSVITLTVMAAAMEIFADVCQKFGQMDWSALAKAGAAVGGILLLAAGFTLLSGLAPSMMSSAASLLIMAAALSVLTPVLTTLGGMSWEGIIKGLVTIAGAFVIFGLAGLLLKPVIPSILALSGAIALFGLGCLAAGAGILMLSAGLTALAGVTVAAATGIVAALTIIIVGVLKLIPTIIDVLTETIVALCQVFIQSIPAICEVVRVLVVEVVKTLLECVPTILDGIVKLIDMLVEYTPQLVNGLVNLIVAILGALSSRSSDLIGSLVGFLVVLFDGISDNIAPLIESWVNLFGAIFQGVADAIGPIVQNVIAPILQVLANLIVGIVEAIAPYIPTISEAIVKITDTIANAAVKIVEAIAPIVPKITEMIQAIVNAIVSIVEQISPIIDSITGLIKQLGDSISDILGAAGDVVKDFGEAIRTGLDGVADIFDSAFGGISDVIGSVGNTIEKFLNGISGVIDSVGEAALNSGEGFKKLASGIKTITDLNLLDMASSMAAVAGGIKKIAKHSSELSEAGNGIQKIAKSADALTSACTTMNTGIDKVVSSLSKMSSAAEKALSSLTSKVDQFKSAGKKLSTNFVNGLKNGSKDAKNAGKELVSKASSAVKSEEHYGKFKSAGKYLGDGLIEGINAKQTAVYKAGFALGQKAVQGEKDGQKSKSPSKLTIKAGKWLGEGLVIGMEKMYSRVYNSGYSLGETAVDSISTTVARIAEAMDSDIDAQPTIRPVLDLSDVRAGASSISGMFNSRPSVGVLSNVRAITSMMNGNQNGGNDDVISAIKDLGNKMSGKTGDTYQVNGITYDDGSNVSDAVATLVRAVRVERRR